MPELSGNSNTTVTLRPVSQRVPVVAAMLPFAGHVSL